MFSGGIDGSKAGLSLKSKPHKDQHTHQGSGPCPSSLPAQLQGS